MRDAFGGAFSIKLLLIFLILYISFICVALNYAKAFRVKNRIINLIEQNEGINLNNNNDPVNVEIQQYLASAGYNIDAAGIESLKSKSKCGSNIKQPGYCIYKIAVSADGRTSYYGVETYMLFRLPIMNLDFPIVVRGETRVIEIP